MRRAVKNDLPWIHAFILLPDVDSAWQRLARSLDLVQSSRGRGEHPEPIHRPRRLIRDTPRIRPVCYRRAIGIDPNETNAVDEAERGGLTEAEYEVEQALAQQALDAGVDLRADAEEEDTRPRHERNGVDEALIYGPAEEWQQPAGDEATLEQALAGITMCI